MNPASRSKASLVLALAAGGCIMAWRMGGPEPALWLDTIGDQKLVTDCLDAGHCRFEGMHASVPGIRVATGWATARTLLDHLGISPTQVHQGINVLEGLVVPLAGLAGLEVAGPGAALLSALASGLLLHQLDLQHGVLYNSRPVPFAGALFLLLALQAVRRRSVLALVLASTMAAVTANVHPVNGFLGLSAIGCGLLFPARRLRMAGLALAAFAIALFAGAPWMWVANLRLLFVEGGFRPHGAQGGDILTGDLLPWMAVGMAGVACLVLRPGRDPSRRRDAAAVLATLAPMALVFLASVLTRAVPMSDKYLAALVGPIALALGWPAAQAFGALLDRTALRTRLQALPPRLRNAAVIAGPWAVAAAIALMPADPRVPRGSGGYVGPATLTLPDVSALADRLRDLPGWGQARLFRALGHPAAGDILAFLQLLPPLPDVPDDPDDRARLLVLKVPGDRVPATLPAGWFEVRRRGGMALVAAPIDGWIDWHRFKACSLPPPSPGDDGCRDLRYVPDPDAPSPVPLGMPVLPSGTPATLQLRLDLRVPPAPAEHVVVLPPIAGLCPGRVVEVEGARHEMSGDGTRVRLLGAGADGSDGRMTVRWDLDGRPDQTCFYDGFPPLLLEGTPEEVDTLLAMLARTRVAAGGAP